MGKRLMIDTTALLREAYLRAAYAEIRAEEKNIERDRAFYDGKQGIVFTARQKEYLGDIASALTDQALCNICRRAVDIPAERLALESIAAGDEAGQAYADMAVGWWRANSLRSWQAWLYEYALRDSASCLVVGWDGAQPTYTLNELYDGVSGQVRLHYDPDSGGLAFASKRFSAVNPATLLPTGKTRLTVYFADRIERYEDDRGAPDGWRLLSAEEAGAVNPQPWLDRDGAPLGVPVIVFDNPGGSELDDILMPQKAMNKSLADLLAAQDFHGFPLLALVGLAALAPHNLPDRHISQPGIPVPEHIAILGAAGREERVRDLPAGLAIHQVVIRADELFQPFAVPGNLCIHNTLLVRNGEGAPV
jgi:hypothetical protein